MKKVIIDIFKNHPLYGKYDESGVREFCKTKGCDKKKTNGIVGFFKSQQKFYLRDIKLVGESNIFIYLRIDAIRDDRTCDYCLRNDRKIIKIEQSGEFIKHYSPFALGCRTTAGRISKSLLQSNGIDVNDKNNYISETPPIKCQCEDWLLHHNWR